MKSKIGFSLACVFTLVAFIAGCGGVKINEAARQEAEKIEGEAIALYAQARKSMSLADKYRVEGAIELDDEATRNEKFAAAATGMEKARDKYTAASAKMTEALNGQKAFDNAEATQVSRMSTFYKSWADIAEFERKIWSDVGKLKDKEQLRAALNSALTTYKRDADALESQAVNLRK